MAMPEKDLKHERDALDAIAAARVRSGASQEQVRDMIVAHPFGHQVTLSTYQKWEQGKSRPTGMVLLVWIDVVNQLCEAAGVEPTPFKVGFPLIAMPGGKLADTSALDSAGHGSSMPRWLTQHADLSALTREADAA